MQAEVKTRARVTRKGEPELVVEVALLPRGSGNRYKARKLAEVFRSDARVKDHIKRVVCGTSKVTVHFRSSLALIEVFNQIAAEEKERKRRDLPGQGMLFRLIPA